MEKKTKGEMIIIGGHEDKGAHPEILKEVADRVKGSKDGLVVVTVATTEAPEASAARYTKVFGKLGVENVYVMDIRTRSEAQDEEKLKVLEKSAVVFFTGGDQLRITSQIGDSPVFRCMREIYYKGGTIVGTSAGAAAMPDTMLISGAGDESNKISTLGMAPGLSFLSDVVIDSHFAERGRMGRLLGAVSQNPKNLGIGIDEDTAIIVENESRFRVIGSGAVYVVDGTGITYSSLSDKNPEGVLSLYNVKLHVLGKDDCFDLVERCPIMKSVV